MFPALLLAAGTVGYRAMSSPSAGGSWAPIVVGLVGVVLTLVPWHRNPGDYGEVGLAAFAVAVLFLVGFGAIFLGAPVTGLAAASPMLGAFGAYRVGFVSAVRDQSRTRRYARASVTTLIVANAVLAFAQSAARSGVASLGFLLDWDIAARAAAGYDPITTRSMGFLLNPNSLGYLAAACLLAVLLLSPPSRQWWLGIVASVSCIILSGSRTAIAAAVIGVAAGQAVSLAWIPKGQRRTRAWAWMAVGAVSGGLLFTFGDRVMQTYQAAMFSGTDENLVARVEAWRSAWAVIGERPLGVLAPPQAATNQLIDNEYVYLALLGSPALAGLFIGVLLAVAATALRRAHPTGPWVVGACFVIGVTALSQTVTPELATLLLLYLAGVARGSRRGIDDPHGLQNEVARPRPTQRSTHMSRSRIEPGLQQAGLSDR